MDDELDGMDWEDVFFDGDFFVDDQRGAERHSAQVQVAFAHRDQRLKASSVDLSDDGLFIATSTILALDSTFKLVLKLPTCDEIIRAVGRVAWIRSSPGGQPAEQSDKPVGFGVQFVSIADDDRTHIAEFIELRSALLNDSDDIPPA